MGVLSALPDHRRRATSAAASGSSSGGVVAAYVLQQNQPAPITPGDGALVGLLAGLVGAVVHLVLSIPIDILVAPMERAMVQRIVEHAGTMPPEVPRLRCGRADRSAAPVVRPRRRLHVHAVRRRHLLDARRPARRADLPQDAPPVPIDASPPLARCAPARALHDAASACIRRPRARTSIASPASTPKIWDVDWVSIAVDAGSCAGASCCARAGGAGAAAAAGADADAAADAARRARARRRPRQPRVHADLRAAGADQGPAAAARPRHEPERRPRPGDRRVVHRRAEERHRPAGARPDSAAARPRLRGRRRRSSASSGASPRRACSTSTTSPPSAPATSTRRRRRRDARDGSFAARHDAATKADVFADLAKGVQTLLSERAHVQRRSQGRAAAGDRLPRAARSRRASTSTRSRTACSARCRSTRASSRSS